MRKENFIFQVCLLITIIKSSSESDLRVYLTFDIPDVPVLQTLNKVSLTDNQLDETSKIKQTEEITTNNSGLNKQEKNRIHYLNFFGISVELYHFIEVFRKTKLEITLKPSFEIEIGCFLEKFSSTYVLLIKGSKLIENFCITYFINFQSEVSKHLNNLDTHYIENCMVYDSEEFNTQNKDSSPFTSDKNLPFEQKFALLLFSFKKIFMQLKENNIGVNEEYAKIFKELYDKYINFETSNTESENKLAMKVANNFENITTNNPEQYHVDQQKKSMNN
ncbi:hypothetical protein GVAV_000706 [Gurleya vavrai]